ncbi:MAG: hypothetical protein QXG12_04640 [Thermoproteota archaeon]
MRMYLQVHTSTGRFPLVFRAFSYVGGLTVSVVLSSISTPSEWIGSLYGDRLRKRSLLFLPGLHREGFYEGEFFKEA